MRHQSVRHSSDTVKINRQEKEKEKVMRKSFTTALVLVAALTVAAPTYAGPRDRTEPPSLTVILKKIVKRIFGVQTQADPIIPVPAPTTT